MSGMRLRRGAVVEHRVEKREMRNRIVAGVAHEERKRRRETAASAHSPNRDRTPVEAKFCGRLVEIFETIAAIAERGPIGKCEGEPLVDRENDGARGGSERAHRAALADRRTPDITSAWPVGDVTPRPPLNIQHPTYPPPLTT